MALYSKMLGQLRPADTAAATLYTRSQDTVVFLDQLYICNTTGSGVTYRFFIVDDGACYDETSALWYDTALAANATATYDLNAFMLVDDGTVGVRSGTGNAINFTLFGEEVFG